MKRNISAVDLNSERSTEAKPSSKVVKFKTAVSIHELRKQKVNEVVQDDGGDGGHGNDVKEIDRSALGDGEIKISTGFGMTRLERTNNNKQERVLKFCEGRVSGNINRMGSIVIPSFVGCRRLYDLSEEERLDVARKIIKGPLRLTQKTSANTKAPKNIFITLTASVDSPWLGNDQERAYIRKLVIKLLSRHSGRLLACMEGDAGFALQLRDALDDKVNEVKRKLTREEYMRLRLVEQTKWTDGFSQDTIGSDIREDSLDDDLGIVYSDEAVDVEESSGEAEDNEKRWKVKLPHYHICFNAENPAARVTLKRLEHAIVQLLTIFQIDCSEVDVEHSPAVAAYISKDENPVCYPSTVDNMRFFGRKLMIGKLIQEKTAELRDLTAGLYQDLPFDVPSYDQKESFDQDIYHKVLRQICNTLGYLIIRDPMGKSKNNDMEHPVKVFVSLDREYSTHYYDINTTSGLNKAELDYIAAQKNEWTDAIHKIEQVFSTMTEQEMKEYSKRTAEAKRSNKKARAPVTPAYRIAGWRKQILEALAKGETIGWTFSGGARVINYELIEYEDCSVHLKDGGYQVIKKPLHLPYMSIKRRFQDRIALSDMKAWMHIQITNMISENFLTFLVLNAILPVSRLTLITMLLGETTAGKSEILGALCSISGTHTYFGRDDCAFDACEMGMRSFIEEFKMTDIFRLIDLKDKRGDRPVVKQRKKHSDRAATKQPTFTIASNFDYSYAAQVIADADRSLDRYEMIDGVATLVKSDQHERTVLRPAQKRVVAHYCVTTTNKDEISDLGVRMVAEAPLMLTHAMQNLSFGTDTRNCARKGLSSYTITLEAFKVLRDHVRRDNTFERGVPGSNVLHNNQIMHHHLSTLKHPITRYVYTDPIVDTHVYSTLDAFVLNVPTGSTISICQNVGGKVAIGTKNDGKVVIM